MSVYLHQVVEARDGALTRFLDLPDALASSRRGERHWRIHFHVPIFLERLGRFRNTQSELKKLLRAVSTSGATPHLEVETYTFGLLPEEHRVGSVLDAISRELRWVLAQRDP